MLDNLEAKLKSFTQQYGEFMVVHKDSLFRVKKAMLNLCTLKAINV